MTFRTPRLRFSVPSLLTCCGVLCFGFVGWSLFSALEEEQDLEVLFQGDAPAMERVQSAEMWAKRGEAAIPRLREALESSDPKTREFGLLALVYMQKTEARLLLGEVKRLCEDPNPSVQSNALSLMGKLTLKPEEFAPIAASKLLSPEARINDAARRTLAEMGPSVVPSVVKVLPQTSPHIHASCLSMLAGHVFDERVGTQAGEAIARGLVHADPIVRVPAFGHTAYYRDFTADEVALGLDDSSGEIVRLVLVKCARENLGDSRSLPKLAELLKTQPYHCELVLASISHYGPDASKYFEEIRSFTTSHRSTTRLAALVALVKVSEDFDRVRPVLREMLSDPHPDVAQSAGELWSEYAPNELPAVIRDELMPRLRSANATRQFSAAAALAGMPRAAAPHRTELVRMISDQSAGGTVPLWVQVQIVEALGNMGPSARDAAPAVLGVLQRMAPRDPRISVAVTALGKIGSAPPGAVDMLISVYQRTSPRGPFTSRIAVLEALGELGRGHASAIDLLHRNVTTPRLNFGRLTALKALAKASDDKGFVRETCEFLLTDERASVRLAAAAELVELGGGEELAMDLAMLLEDESPRVRLYAANSLRSLGADAKVALPALSRALTHLDVSNFEEDEEHAHTGSHTEWGRASFPPPKRGSFQRALRAAIEAITNSESTRTAQR